MLGGGAWFGDCPSASPERLETVLWDIDEPARQKGLTPFAKTFAYPIKQKKMSEQTSKSCCSPV